MPVTILVSPVGAKDPLGNQQQRVIAVATIAYIDPVWTVDNSTKPPTETQTGATISLVSGAKLPVTETMAAIMTAAG